MKEKLEELIKEVEAKINLEFDFEVEHWENGNYDDSYSYGVETGEEYAYRDILVALKKLYASL
jgi:hypothetical protein